VVSSADISQAGGSSDRTSALDGANFGFFEFYSARTGKGAGWVSADILRTRGRGGLFFAICCKRLLWTEPNWKI